MFLVILLGYILRKVSAVGLYKLSSVVDSKDIFKPGLGTL